MKLLCTHTFPATIFAFVFFYFFFAHKDRFLLKKFFCTLAAQGDDGEAVEQWPVSAGAFVTLYITGVPLAALAQQLDAGNVLAVFGLLEYENKMSVLNFKLTMHASATAPIRAKEPLVFWSGFRRFTARPQFSEPSTGEKHKFVAGFSLNLFLKKI